MSRPAAFSNKNIWRPDSPSYQWQALKKSLNTLAGNGKRFMAYDIIRRLELHREYQLLTTLQHAVTARERKRGKKHEIWEDSFDIKECRTEKFVLQKLHYIHNNPCSGKWKLANAPLHYEHSSASFYINCKKGNYPVRDYREFIQYDPAA
jgi:hypothetical protein